MTNSRKDETGAKAASGATSTKQEPTAQVLKDTKPETTSASPHASSSASPPLPANQSETSRTAIDEGTTAKIAEALRLSGANMTRIAAEMGVSYNAVQSIKSKLQRASGSPEQRRTAIPGRDLEIQLLKLENDYLKRRLALFEPEQQPW